MIRPFFTYGLRWYVEGFLLWLRCFIIGHKEVRRPMKTHPNSKLRGIPMHVYCDRCGKQNPFWKRDFPRGWLE